MIVVNVMGVGNVRFKVEFALRLNKRPDPGFHGGIIRERDPGDKHHQTQLDGIFIQRPRFILVISAALAAFMALRSSKNRVPS